MTRRKVTLEEMHELQLHMLDCIHAYCTENNIRYSLGGGTLLGAIRHKGFIPWDDDVDIMMPRPDYERFLQGFYGKYEHYTLQNYKTTPYYILPFAKVYDDRTELREGSMISGVYIDVFPIDGMGEERNLDQYYNRLGKLIWKRHLFHAPWYQLDFKLKIYRLFYHSRMRVMKNIDKYTSFFDFETSECTGCAVGRYGRKEQMGCDTFKHYIDVPFEGRTYRAIADYDAYLTKHYGDYMILPPECERKGGHAITSWWKK